MSRENPFDEANNQYNEVTSDDVYAEMSRRFPHAVATGLERVAAELRTHHRRLRAETDVRIVGSVELLVLS